MTLKTYDEPSPQTYQAIGGAREEFAATRGVTRNAVDQMMAGNCHDPYQPFRDHFKDVCLTAGADPDVYLNDLQSIKQSARGCSKLTVGEAYLNQLQKAHRAIEVGAHALKDGELDREECLRLIPLLSKTEDAMREMKQAVIDRKNVLDGVPAVREFARNKVNGKRS